MKITSIILCLFLIFASCSRLFKDEEFSIKRVPYNGKEFRTDGYYYTYRTSFGSKVNDETAVIFFFRNGIKIVALNYDGTDLTSVEKQLVDSYDEFIHQKTGWGVYIVSGNTIQGEEWSTSAGGGLPVYKWSATIENDSTIRYNHNNEVWHFKQFSNKPDSTNVFIK